ncbi:substrate-binding domain-containing protein [Luteococcus sp. OSA5]|uniref:substrate-binding domain-containing protein n=1 Tax=Luteococcus sp. OSA5 TaxID=3401630 RepID=UPI003B430366
MSTALVGLGSMATRHLLAEMEGLAAASGVAAVRFSAGGGVEVAERIRQREQADVVVLAARAVEELADQGHLLAETVRPAFVSEAVIGVPSGSDASVPTDTGQLRQLLLDASSIGYSTGPSGKAFLSLVEELGLTRQLDGRLEQARPGHPVGGMVAQGQIDVGIQQLSEMAGLAGVTVLGPLPEPHRITSVFVAAVAATSRRREQATELVEFITSPSHRELVEGHGMSLAAQDPSTAS